MQHLLKYLKDYKKESILGPLFKLLEASFELMVPLLVAMIIDTGIPNQDTNYIIKLCILMIILGIVGLICAITAQYFAAKAAVGFGTKLRYALFSHLQQLSFTEIDQIGTSTMITRMTSDINQVQSGVNLVLRLFLRSPFVVFGAMILAFTIDVKAALVFVVIIPLLLLVVFGIMMINIPMFKKVQQSLDIVLRKTRENLTGVRVIRAFCMETSEKEEFQSSNDELTRIQLFAGKISALMNPITYVIINVGIIALIWVGAIRVDLGIISQGAVVALVSYMSQILTELIKMANLIVSITKSLACANRIQSVFEITSSQEMVKNDKEETIEIEENEPQLQFNHVSLTYSQAGEESLSDIHFSVHKGETIGIIGGTGSGKTSLVHLIPRFYDATKGNILFHGKDITTIDMNWLRKKVAVVMQKSVLFHGTIRDNIRFGTEEATDEDIYEALDIAMAREIVDKKEKGLDEVIHQGGKNLSGGQRQRLAIARALVRKPEILILDDSSSALDYATDAKLRFAINHMENKPTVFIVSQRTTSIQHADNIIVLDDGKIVGMGKHEELLERCSVYQEIYYSQFPKKESVLETTSKEKNSKEESWKGNHLEGNHRRKEGQYEK